MVGAGGCNGERMTLFITKRDDCAVMVLRNAKDGGLVNMWDGLKNDLDIYRGKRIRNADNLMKDLNFVDIRPEHFNDECNPYLTGLIGRYYSRIEKSYREKVIEFYEAYVRYMLDKNIREEKGVFYLAGMQYGFEPMVTYKMIEHACYASVGEVQVRLLDMYGEERWEYLKDVLVRA